MQDMSEVSIADLSARVRSERSLVVVFFVATWENGECCHDARPLFHALRDGGEAAREFCGARRYSVCGLGSSAPRYLGTYQRAARDLTAMLAANGGVAVCDMGEEDEQVPICRHPPTLKSLPLCYQHLKSLQLCC